MHRLALRISGLALTAAMLGGCSMMGGDQAPASSTPSAPASSADASMPTGTDIGMAVRQAQLMRVGGDLDGATKILSQLMLVQPDDPRVVGEYGKLLVQRNQPGEAVAFLQRAIELQPGDWTLYSALGVAYDKQSNPNAAMKAYEQALAMKPGEAAVLNNYAMSRMLAGDTARARILLMQAKASGSADPRIASNLAMLDRMAPVAAGTAPAEMPSATMAATTAPRPVAVQSRPIAPVSAPPQMLAHNGTAGVMMQAVPFDPKAGPVGAHAAKGSKAAKLAKAAAHPAKKLAAATAPKPVKADKPKKSGIPALRMTADKG